MGDADRQRLQELERLRLRLRAPTTEDFAESVEFYWLAPRRRLLRVSPEKFAYMRDVVFETQSPAASRVPTHQTIAPVRRVTAGRRARPARSRW
ncbi:MAG: hypothetical protein KIT58_03760 [Planctomycetota bacterium]|nr:hypothetical protein [Planctomycetota bacterium]